MRTRGGRAMLGRGAVVAVSAALAIGAVAAIPAASVGAPGGDRLRSADGRAAEFVQALRRGSGTLAPRRAVGASASIRASAVTGPGTISEADVLGDVDSRVDISNVSATMAAGRIRLGVTLPSGEMTKPKDRPPSMRTATV